MVPVECVLRQAFLQPLLEQPARHVARAVHSLLALHALLAAWQLPVSAQVLQAVQPES